MAKGIIHIWLEVEELIDEIAVVVENISRETLLGMMYNFSQHLQMISDAQGLHKEHLNNKLQHLTCSMTPNLLMSVQYISKYWNLKLLCPYFMTPYVHVYVYTYICICVCIYIHVMCVCRNVLPVGRSEHDQTQRINLSRVRSSLSTKCVIHTPVSEL
jgi:hypothetical protein